MLLLEPVRTPLGVFVFYFGSTPSRNIAYGEGNAFLPSTELRILLSPTLSPAVVYLAAHLGVDNPLNHHPAQR